MVFKKLLGKESLLRSSVLVTFLKGSGALFNFITLILITNFFSEDVVGQFNYLNSMILLLGAIALLGTNESFFYYTGRLESENAFYKIKEIYFKKLIIIAVTSSLILIFFLLFRYFFPEAIEDPKVDSALLKTCWGVFFYSVSMLNFQVIRGLKKLMVSEIYRNLVRYLLLLVIIFILWFYKQEAWLLDGFIVSFVVLAIVTTLYVVKLLFALTPNDGADPITLSKEYGYKGIIKTSYPMTISYLSLLIMQSMDVMVLKRYYDFDVIAYYGVIIRISILASIVLLSVNTVIAPQISELFHGGQMKQLEALVKKSVKLNALLTTPIFLCMLVLPKTILRFFGEEYTVAAQPLMIITAGQVVYAFFGVAGLYMNMTGRQGIFQRILIVALVLNILLNFLLIPQYGMIGASVSTALSLLMWNLFTVFYVYKKDGISFFVKLR